MKETELQSYVIAVVCQQRNGFAYKLSSRFLVGVADLIIKLPSYQVALVEVKQRELTKGLDSFKLDVTHLQYGFLRQASNAGINSGVMSFVQKGRRRMLCGLFGLDRLDAASFNVRLSDHTDLGDHKVRDGMMMFILRAFLTNKEFELGQRLSQILPSQQIGRPNR